MRLLRRVKASLLADDPLSGNAILSKRGRIDEFKSVFSVVAEEAKGEAPTQHHGLGGQQRFNYEATLEYLGFLYGLGIPVERLVAQEVDHNQAAFYEVHGEALLQFHDQHRRNAD